LSFFFVQAQFLLFQEGNIKKEATQQGVEFKPVIEGTTNLSDLPDEVLVSIFALQPLSVTDIANLSLVI